MQPTQNTAAPPACGTGLMATEVPAEVPEWVMIARTGEWMGHPTTPQTITPEMLNSSLEYFERHYRAHGADLVIDYHHGSAYAGRLTMKAPAAGWVREMELRNSDTELWGRVLWTTEARDAIAAREFRYLSPFIYFNRPDRVTGEPVPMSIHSVALTNTPFLTELEALNQDLSARDAQAGAGMDAGVTSANPNTGGGEMPILKQVAEALDKTPEQVASALGLESAEAEDKAVAARVMECAANVGAHGDAPTLPEGVANALGVAQDADPAQVRGVVMSLKAQTALTAVRTALGLDDRADEAAMVNAIGALQEDHRKNEAQALVDGAVEGGKIPPAQKEFWLNSATQDIEAAKSALNALPVITAPAGQPRKADGGTRALSREEAGICRQLGITEDQFLDSCAALP